MFIVLLCTWDALIKTQSIYKWHNKGCFYYGSDDVVIYNLCMFFYALSTWRVWKYQKG